MQDPRRTFSKHRIKPEPAPPWRFITGMPTCQGRILACRAAKRDLKHAAYGP
jgi:hypothetical protein